MGCDSQFDHLYENKSASQTWSTNRVSPEYVSNLRKEVDRLRARVKELEQQQEEAERQDRIKKLETELARLKAQG